MRRSLALLPLALLVAACGQSFDPKTVSLDGATVEALVPQGWREELTSSAATYTSPTGDALFTIGTTCHGACQPDAWKEKTAAQAGAELAALKADAADVKVIFDGESKPGRYVFFVRARAGERPRTIVQVWHYAPDSENIVSCRAELPAGAHVLANGVLAACQELRRVEG